MNMGEGSLELGKKLFKLETTLNETLPGVGTISKRIETSEKVLKEYQGEVKKGVDKVVSRELRGAIDSVRKEVKHLAWEVSHGGSAGNNTANTTLLLLEEGSRAQSRALPFLGSST